MLSRSAGKIGRHSNHLRLKIHLKASFPGLMSLRDPAAAVSRAARSDGETLRATKRGGKGLANFCGKLRGGENSFAESRLRIVENDARNGIDFALSFFFFVMPANAGIHVFFLFIPKEKRGSPGQAR